MQLRRLATTDRQLLTLDEIKDSLGLGWPDEQRDLRMETQIIPAAIAYAEDQFGLTLQQSTWEYIRSGWPADCQPIELPRPPTLCLLEFTHSTLCSDWVQVDEANFRIQAADTGMLIYPCECWPRNACCVCATCSGCPPRVKLKYEAGYQEFGDLPGNLREGLMLFVDYLLTRNDISRDAADQLMGQQSNLRAVGHYG